jgi:Sulfotransferase domain
LLYRLLRPVREASFRWRMLTRAHRILPSFLIIGAQRSGTTTLYRYLNQHHLVLPSFRQEVHYFDDGFRLGLDWYRAHFALVLQRDLLERTHGAPPVTGEASGYYLFHPHAVRRISQVLPEARLIVILRDPVERAWAHYHQSVRKGETLSFEEAIRTESARIGPEKDKMMNDESYVSWQYRRYSYLRRGLYADQLARLRSRFPREQILVLRSEELLFEDPGATLKRVTGFLGLPRFSPRVFTRPKNYYPPIPAATKAWLTEYFREPNRTLFQQEGIDFGWELPDRSVDVT